jgi:hypothetical protein
LTSTSSTFNLGVKDFGDLVFWFPIDCDGWGRWLNSVRDGVRSCGFELGDMENRVDRSHSIRKTDGEGMRTRTSYDIERSKVLFGQFLRWTSGAEILRFDEDLLSDLEIWCGFTSSVSRALISILRIRHLIPKELMELIEVDCVLSGPGG